MNERDSSLTIPANPYVNMRARFLEPGYGTWTIVSCCKWCFLKNKKAKDWARLGAHVSVVR